MNVNHNALQIRVDEDMAGAISNLRDVVDGLTDADGVYWDDWTEEAKAAFLQPYGFDPTDPSREPPDKVLNDILGAPLWPPTSLQPRN